VNVTGLVQLHEGKRHHESDSGPLETPDDRFKHPDDTLARELQPSTSRTLDSGRFANAATGLQNFYARKHKPTVSADREWSVDHTVYLPSAFGPLSSAFSFRVSATAILRATRQPMARPRSWAPSSWLRASYAVWATAKLAPLPRLLTLRLFPVFAHKKRQTRCRLRP